MLLYCNEQCDSATVTVVIMVSLQGLRLEAGPPKDAVRRRSMETGGPEEAGKLAERMRSIRAKPFNSPAIEVIVAISLSRRLGV